MSEIIEKTYDLLDILDNSKLIKDLTLYKNKLLNNKNVLLLINKINDSNDDLEKVRLKKELYENDDYKKYMDCYNELSYIVLRINMQYRKYTNTRGNNG